MFNADRKERYIDENKDRNVALDVDMHIKFGNAEAYETSLDKDLCDFTIPEILTYYKTILTPSLEYLMVLNSDFKKYTDWCMSNGLVFDCQNHYSEITNDVLIKCVHTALSNEKFITKEDLKKYMKEMPNVSESLLLLAYFDGIGGKDNCELVNLQPDQIVGDELHLCSGRVLPCSEELKDLIIESANEYKYFEVKDGNGKRRGNYDINDPKCFKQLYNQVDVARPRTYGQRLRVKLDRIKDYTGCEAIMSKSLKESGRIYYMLLNSKEEDIDNVENFVRANIEATEPRYGKVPSIPRYLIKYSGLIQEQLNKKYNK